MLTVRYVIYFSFVDDIMFPSNGGNNPN